MSETKTLAGQIKKIEAVAPRVPLQRTRFSFSYGFYNETRSAYLTHDKKWRAAGTDEQQKRPDLSPGCDCFCQPKGKAEGGGGSLYVDRNWNEFRE